MDYWAFILMLIFYFRIRKAWYFMNTPKPSPVTNLKDIIESNAKRYGDRKKDFYYASVEKIFEYSKAVDQLKITENTVENPTSFEIFVKIDGKNTTIPSKTILKL